MSIEKKSLISTLKTTKKANVASSVSSEGVSKSLSVNPKAAGKFPKAVGKFPKAAGKFPKAAGKFPKAASKLPKIKSVF
ncbi:MAG TPA: hypothetical protein VMH20_07995 [Verrucomicrobiae bacterium]|nr:hypothetical protein [Verrucomicrobiae bacterium]